MSQSPTQTLSATAQQAMLWQTQGNQQIAEDTAELKAMGEPIYYERDGQLIREDADGKKFAYRLDANGNEDILFEITE